MKGSVIVIVLALDSEFKVGPVTRCDWRAWGLFLIVMVSMGRATYADDSRTSAPAAVSAITKMLRSMNHIHTFQGTATIVKTNGRRTSTVNAQLYADSDSQAAAKILPPYRAAYVKNKRGYFVVQNGEVRREPRTSEFPFDVPTTFFSKMAVKDVTDNYKFIVVTQSETAMTIELIPIGTGGKSVAESTGEMAVTMLRFHLNMPECTLAKLELFKNNALTTNDTIEIKYDMIDTRRVVEKRFFRDKYASTTERVPVWIRTVTSRPARRGVESETEIRVIRYGGVRVNEKIDPDRFNEESY